jgi:hypothetical protein
LKTQSRDELKISKDYAIDFIFKAINDHKKGQNIAIDVKREFDKNLGPKRAYS